jgi:hypothetical protein
MALLASSKARGGSTQNSPLHKPEGGSQPSSDIEPELEDQKDRPKPKSKKQEHKLPAPPQVKDPWMDTFMNLVKKPKSASADKSSAKDSIFTMIEFEDREGKFVSFPSNLEAFVDTPWMAALARLITYNEWSPIKADAELNPLDFKMTSSKQLLLSGYIDAMAGTTRTWPQNDTTYSKGVKRYMLSKLSEDIKYKGNWAVKPSPPGFSWLTQGVKAKSSAWSIVSKIINLLKRSRNNDVTPDLGMFIPIDQVKSKLTQSAKKWMKSNIFTNNETFALDAKVSAAINIGNADVKLNMDAKSLESYLHIYGEVERRLKIYSSVNNSLQEVIAKRVIALYPKKKEVKKKGGTPSVSEKIPELDSKKYYTLFNPTNLKFALHIPDYSTISASQGNDDVFWEAHPDGSPLNNEYEQMPIVKDFINNLLSKIASENNAGAEG